MTATHGIAGSARRGGHAWMADSGLAAALARMGAAGAPGPRLLADLAALAAGPGRVSLADYEELRLFDLAFWAGADRKAVAGRARARTIARVANFRRDWYALAGDAIAGGAYLAAHGLPTVPTIAVYREGLAAAGDRVLRTREELRAFLQARAEPILFTPSDSAAPKVFLGEAEPDRARAIDRLVEDAADRPATSWIVQPLTRAHANAPRDPSGAPPPVRLLTLASERGARVVRAVWRLGGRRDAVASLDLKTGEARQVFAAASPEGARSPPPGLAVPDWDRLKAAVVEGARVLSAFGLLGWEIAPAEGGPMILRFDPQPDLSLWQLADRRGILTPEFETFLAERRRLRSSPAC